VTAIRAGEGSAGAGPMRFPVRGAAERLARRFGKFGLVGLSGVAVNLGLFWLLSTVLRLHYLFAGAVAIEVALCSNYILNSRWTFADRSGRLMHLPALVRYHAVSLGGMLINLVVLQLLAGGAGVRPALANVAGIALATGWNFSLNLGWTWRRR
jgi:dolichol-phosphate mannosyltransferase